MKTPEQIIAARINSMARHICLDLAEDACEQAAMEVLSALDAGGYQVQQVGVGAKLFAESVADEVAALSPAAMTRKGK